MKQYDVVRIIKDDPNNEFTKRQVGTILEVYEDNDYEVEISDKDGITLFLGAISGDYLQQKMWNNIVNIRTIFTN